VGEGSGEGVAVPSGGTMVGGGGNVLVGGAPAAVGEAIGGAVGAIVGNCAGSIVATGVGMIKSGGSSPPPQADTSDANSPRISGKTRRAVNKWIMALMANFPPPLPGAPPDEPDNQYKAARDNDRQR
jgi:hypothetical protein